MQERPLRLLLVEDSLADALLVMRRFEAELGSLDPIDVERVTSLEQAVRFLQNQPPVDVVLLDLTLPDSVGTETVYRMRQADPWVPIVVYASIAGEVGLPLRALHAGAQDFLGKGDFECGSLIDRIRSAIERTRIYGETQRLQREFEDAERVQNLGVLGVGAALGFNQLIGAVLDHTDGVMAELADVPNRSRAMAHLLEARTAALRAIDLAAHLRDYGRPDRAVEQQIRISDFVRAERPQLEMIAGRGIELACTLEHPDPPVSINPLELRQILFNLVINASEAIRPDTGRIGIDTGEIWADAELLATGRGAADLREGRYALLCVRDTGRRLDSEGLARLFDPPLTTRVPGRLLGLAPALGAVRRHGGWIGGGHDLTDNGTRFQVLFPVAA